MKEIGFVGLGDMGSGMAGNLLRAGFMCMDTIGSGPAGVAGA